MSQGLLVFIAMGYRECVYHCSQISNPIFISDEASCHGENPIFAPWFSLAPPQKISIFD